MIEANELRVQGIKAIDRELEAKQEAYIAYRGKAKYVVIECGEYERLRAAELDAAYIKSLQEIEEGKFETIDSPESLEKHIASL